MKPDSDTLYIHMATATPLKYTYILPIRKDYFELEAESLVRERIGAVFDELVDYSWNLRREICNTACIDNILTKAPL